MANQGDNHNQPSKENHGSPSQSEQPKGAGNLPVENLEEEQRLADEYTNDGLDEVPAHLVNNPNRNYDKPDLDKPAYN